MLGFAPLAAEPVGATGSSFNLIVWAWQLYCRRRRGR